MKEQMGLESGKVGDGLSEPSHHESTPCISGLQPFRQDDEEETAERWGNMVWWDWLGVRAGGIISNLSRSLDVIWETGE